ncbi:hypothetical protein QTG54_014746 [Skeletonema marinoi]|uniref:Uncharacterized protein n=1 Tax=Skeletonema marinoi TaxID=267567 RepID=A0AAD8XVL0_9STRA|nr:hypothetical protein QTG54_014746 [Skeletonema marinoi]
MRARLNKKVKEAATQTTIVPVAETIENNAMATMTTALSNFQQISLHDLRLPRYKKYSDGDDPAEQSVAETANFISLDIQMLSNFGKFENIRSPMYGDEWKIPFLIQLSAPTQSHMNLNTFLMRLISLGQSIQSQNNAQVCYKIGTGSCRNILLIGTRRETSIYDLHLRFALFKQDHALAINGDLFISIAFNLVK